MTLRTRDETEAILGLPPERLCSRIYREQIGLRAIHLGRLLRFDDDDIREMLERRKDVFKSDEQ